LTDSWLVKVVTGRVATNNRVMVAVAVTGESTEEMAST
jgi:hypothetical protein